MTKTNKDKYGGLLDKYMDDKHVDYRIKMECEKEEKAKPNDTILNDILNVSNACRNIQQKKANEYEQTNIRRQERIEREQREEQERRDRQDAFINDYLKKKETEQKAIAQKKKEEAEKADFYKRIERLANIDPHMAEVYIKASHK